MNDQEDITPTTTPQCRRHRTAAGDFTVSNKEQTDEETRDQDDATMPSGIGYYSSIDKSRQRAHLKRREQRELKERDRNFLEAMVRRFDTELRFNFDDLGYDIQTRMEKMKSILTECLTWDVMIALAVLITFLGLTTIGLILLSSSSAAPEESAESRHHLSENSILIVQEMMKDGGECCCSSSSCWCNPDGTSTDNNNNNNNNKNDNKNTTTTPEIDTWKQHICDMPCIDCNQLLIACSDYGAKGACILHQS